ncbi:MAG: amidohydrolase family protein [Anaerolineae bacterium]
MAGGVVVTMDADFRVIPNGAVAIKGDTIVGVDDTPHIMGRFTAPEVIDCSGKAVIPGLVNAHTHVPMTLLRGLADDLRLDVWLIGYMMPTEREFVSPEFVRLGTLLGCAEMIQSGITTFADMYYFEDTVAEATAEVGMRAVCGQTVLKFPAPDADSYEEALALCREFIIKWKGHPLIIPAVAPHAPYTCTAEILQACATLALEFDVPLHIHLSETAQEVLDSRREHGMPVIPWVKKQNILDTKVIAAHCVHIDQGEMRTLRNHRAGVAHNPSSNLKLASGIARVGQMLDLGLQVGIGTDGPASNNDLDMFEETRLAAFIAKVATDKPDPTTLPARQAFEMATIMGARALHIDHLTGSLEVGKRADIATVTLARLHNWPHFSHDPDALYSRLVYASKASDVNDVICNGRVLMRDRVLQTIAVDPILTQAAEYARRIDAFLIEREGDILSKLLAIGELQREESFEVQVKARLEDPQRLYALLKSEDVTIARHTHYRQYDTYFEFGAPDFYRVRYREDDFVDEDGQISTVRTRLTLTSQSKEREFSRAVVLSHSRYISPATRPLRFYREYFQAASERTVTKERLRWHIDYNNLRLYVNLDQLNEPAMDGYFLEIKSRTWSLTDAENKAAAIADLLNRLQIPAEALIYEDYVAFEAD